MRLKSSLKRSEQVQFSAPSHFTGTEWLVCQGDPLHEICQHTQGAAAVDSRLGTDSGLFSSSCGQHVGFQGNCTLGRLLAQCYRGNHKEHWSLLFWAQPTVRQYKTKGEQKCACKTHAKDICVLLFCYLGIARTHSKPYLTASTAVMPMHSSKVKQPFDFKADTDRCLWVSGNCICARTGKIVVSLGGNKYLYFCPHTI